MSQIPGALSRLMQFYLSSPAPCPYLAQRVERKIFTHLTSDAATNRSMNAILMRSGFRRSHDILYRPACPDCQACVPVRIPVRAFKMSRSLRRVWAENHDLSCLNIKPEATDEHFALFAAYQSARHAQSEMAQMSYAEFASMLSDGQTATRVYEWRDAQGVLYGAMIADHVPDGLSAVYSYFRPDLPKRSLGLYLILGLVEMARQQKRPYVYLGYWIEQLQNMAYKTRFKPLQRLGEQGWTQIP